jgi:hypothetical protein
LATTFDKIKRINGSKPDWTQLCRQLQELCASMSIDGAGPVRAKLQEIVPEYECQSDDPALSKETAAVRSRQHAAGSI